MIDISKTLKTVDSSVLSIENFDSDLHEIYRNGKPFVSIEQFLDDDYYFGKVARDLYPDNRQDLIDIFDPRSTYLEIILAGAIGWGKCVSGETEFYDDITGEMVKVKNAVNKKLRIPAERDGKIFLADAIALESGRKKCLKINVSGGQEITLSLDHPVRVRDGWKKAEDLNLGDKIGVVRKYPEWETKRILNSHIKGIAYLLADGGVTTKSTTFTNMNLKILKEIKELAEEFDVKLRKVKKAKCQNSGKATTILLPGWLWFREKYKLNGRSKEKRLSSILWKVNKNQVGLFLNRFWACDGSIYYNKKPYRIELCLSSKNLINDIQNLLKRFGIVGRVYAKKVKLNGKIFNAWKLQLADKLSILKFLELTGDIIGKEKACKFLRIFLKDIKTNTNWDVVPVKYKDLKRLKGRREWYAPSHQFYSRNKFKKIAENFPFFKYNWLAASDLVWERVKSIEEVGMQKVYDVSVPTVGSWVGNGFVLHNTFLACIGLAYMVGQLSAYKNPHKWLGASPTSPLVFINMSVNAKKAKEIIFTRVKSMVDSSAYFKEQFPRNRRLIDSCEWNINLEETGSRSGQQIHFKPGTGESLSALGDDIYGGACDELNFFRVIEKSKRAFGEVFDPAQKLYDTVTRRMKSRFLAGGLPLGKLFLISSAQLPEDFIERRIDEAKKDDSLGKTVKLIKKSQWGGKRGVFVGGKPVYGDLAFRVEVGSSRKGSRILDTYDEKTKIVTKGDFGDIDGKVLNVPVELWQDFYRDVEGSVRDFGGEVTRAIYPFFPDVEIIYSAEDKTYQHPWSIDQTTLKDGSYLKKELIVEKHIEDGKVFERLTPIYDPKKARYWHIDIALSGDALGLAVVHVAGWKQVQTGPNTIEDKPIIRVDLILKVIPPRGGEINFGNVRSILYQLQQFGLYLRYGSLDLKLMSADFIQIVKSRGLACGHLSVDKDFTPYQVLKDSFYDGRIILYSYPFLLTELSRLEKTASKIDHPMGGSKDLADALAGAVYNAFEHELGASSELLKARLPVITTTQPKLSLKKSMQDEAEMMRKEWGGGKLLK